jgi:hypothetical protein
MPIIIFYLGSPFFIYIARGPRVFYVRVVVRVTPAIVRGVVRVKLPIVLGVVRVMRHSAGCCQSYARHNAG